MSSVILLQIVVTLAVCWLVSRLARLLGQPAVIGEIAAGIALGPTLFGALAPSLQQMIFPPSSMASLKLVAEIGIVFFMFCVGLRVDGEMLHRHRGAAVIVSHASIAVPLVLGLLLARPLYAEYAPRGTPFSAFALFIALAMSITAFPVLARILSEHGMVRTPIGSVVLTCAAVDDLTAWFLLALVSAIARGQRAGAALLVIAAASLFTLTMFFIVKPLLQRIRVNDAGALLLLFTCAAATEWIGVHAIFGAFIAGTIIPRESEPGRTLADRLDSVSLVLLPLFFAYTGLRTNATMLADVSSIAITLLVIAVATLGKLGGSSIAARLMGRPWREALMIGALMNTRGLVALVALDIAYDLGVITQPMFTIMVLMALVTTAATSPLLRLIEAPQPAAD